MSTTRRKNTPNEERVLVHPYVIKLDLKTQQLDRLVNRIYEIADSNLLVTDTRTGEAKFDLNLDFADKLDSMSTIVSGLARSLSEKATSIREQIAKAIDDKRQVEIEEVDFIPPTKKRIKTEVLSSDEENENTPPAENERDGHFMYHKRNENDSEIHSFVCKPNECNSVFRDQNEFRNHQSQHEQEFYTCLRCNKVFRTVQSFDNHQKSHSASHTCSVCGQFFNLKTSLTNHSKIHLNLKLKCSQQNCDKTFSQRSNQLQHIQYGHKNTRTVKCTHCEKYYYTPNNMRAHRYFKHGIIGDITPGHPNFGKRVPLPEQRRQERLKKKTVSKLSKKLASDNAIPTSIAGPLASPPQQVSNTTSVTPDPAPAPLTPNPGRRQRNRSRARPRNSAPIPPPTPSPPRPPQTRQQTQKQDSLKLLLDINDDDLPDINI